MVRPALLFDGGDWWRLRRDKGPVPLPFRPLSNPAFEQIDFRLGEREMRIPGWHQVVGVLRRNSAVKLALGWIPRLDDAKAAFGRAEGSILGVQTELRLALLLVRPVANPTTIRQQRTNLVIEIDRLGGRFGCCGCDPGQEHSHQASSQHSARGARYSMQRFQHESVRRSEWRFASGLRAFFRFKFSLRDRASSNT
jgi:hypothetical protein